MSVNGRLFVRKRQLRDFFLSLDCGGDKDQIFLLCLISLAGGLDGQNRQEKIEQDEEAVHKINGDSAAGIQQVCVDRERIFQNIVRQRKQEKQSQSGLIFLL